MSGTGYMNWREVVVCGIALEGLMIFIKGNQLPDLSDGGRNHHCIQKLAAPSPNVIAVLGSHTGKSESAKPSTSIIPALAIASAPDYSIWRRTSHNHRIRSHLM